MSTLRSMVQQQLHVQFKTAVAVPFLTCVLSTQLQELNDVTSGIEDVFACGITLLWELPETMWLIISWCVKSCEQMKVKVKALVVSVVRLTH